jgi:hypothetical protein
MYHYFSSKVGLEAVQEENRKKKDNENEHRKTKFTRMETIEFYTFLKIF